jgi:hypothetical protein
VDVAIVSGTVAVLVAAITFLQNRQASRRLEQERRDEEARLEQRRRDEEARLKLDAAMRAGGLFSPVDGRPADPAVVASGLLALTKLGHADLAVALLTDLWSSSDEPKRVEHETAVLVIDEALRTDNPKAQLVAAELLCRNATCLDATHSLHWPSVIDGRWDKRFGPKTKLLLLDALIRMTLASHVSEDALRSVAVRLYGVWRAEFDDERIRGCVGRLIHAVYDDLERLGHKDFLAGNEKVLLSDLDRAQRTATNNPDGFMDRMVGDRCKCLRDWSSNCQLTDGKDACLVAAS